MGCNYEEKKNVLSSVTWCHNFLADPIGITRIFKLIKSKSEHRPTFESRNAATGRGSLHSTYSYCPIKVTNMYLLILRAGKSRKVEIRFVGTYRFK